MSDSVRPHRWQPTRLRHPWDSPGKNTGVGCHFLLQSIKVKSESEAAQSCPTLSDPMDCSPPGSFVHGIFQARVLEWGCHRLLRKSTLGRLNIVTNPSGLRAPKHNHHILLYPVALWWCPAELSSIPTPICLRTQAYRTRGVMALGHSLSSLNP